MNNDKKDNIQKPTYISLFSSAGVGCYGFKLEGFDCIATNELIERRLEIQKFNNKCKYPSGYILGDITKQSTKNALYNEIILWKTKENVSDIDVVIATPPCQGMSVANHKKSSEEIVRNSLVVESIKIINNIYPKIFIFENVSAFMKTICTDIDGTNKSIKEVIDSNLSNRYVIKSNILNFKNYGSNSSRTRTLVIGIRKEFCEEVLPDDFFPDYVEEKKLKDIISFLPSLKKMGEVYSKDIYHAFRPYPEYMRKWISSTQEGMSAFDNKDEDCIPYHLKDGIKCINVNKNGDKYKRQIWDKVAPCIHTRNDQLASQNTIHPTDDRVFSIRELMKIMNIPDDFRWTNKSLNELNTLSEKDKQKFLRKNAINIRQSIGEAVPTGVFREIAKKIYTFLQKKTLTATELNQLLKNNDFQNRAELNSFIVKNSNLSFASLSKIVELSNTKRMENSAYYTDMKLLNKIYTILPTFNKEEINVLEPSVGAGNFIPLIMRAYKDFRKVNIDVVEIDYDSISTLKILLKTIKIPNNIQINFINDDFILHKFNKRYDLVVGNPPFSKIKNCYTKNILFSHITKDTQAKNLSAYFLEKSILISDNIVMIMPKNVLNTPEYSESRKFIKQYCIKDIIDFGEFGFSGVLVETICISINTKDIPNTTNVVSIANNFILKQKQSYITDEINPYWIIYRNDFFDDFSQNMQFGIFNVFRDRQITNSKLHNTGDIKVIKSRNINNDGTKIINIDDYDAYINKDDAKNLSVFKYIDDANVYISPNMTYNSRIMKKPMGTLVNGSVAILTLKENIPLSNDDLLYVSTEEYRTFLRIARNYQTRSLNLDQSSIYFFGKRIA